MEKSISLLIFMVALSLCATSCTKKDDAKGEGGAGAAAGCGSDYADPMKEFCIKVPAGYTPKVKAKPPTDTYSEAVDFDATMSGIQVLVGFSDKDYKTYEDERSSAERFMKGVTGRKIDASGKTASEGQWWVYSQGGKFVKAVAKSNSNKAIICESNNTNVTPEVIEACKTIRAYPK